MQAKIAGSAAAQSLLADTTKFSDIESMRQRIESTLGPLDILVANAGGNSAKPGPIEETAEEEWHAAIDGNLTATFLTVKSFLPGMKARRGGAIVTISSAAARRPHPASPIPYAAAKAGIEIFTQDLAVQAGPFGIRANCIAPETILTERNNERIPAATQEHFTANTRFGNSERRMMWRGLHSILRPTTPHGLPASFSMSRAVQ